MFVYVHIDSQIISERAAEHVACLGLGRIFFGKELHPEMFVRNGVVACEKVRLAPTDEITA
jgi:hypothetical protein